MIFGIKEKSNNLVFLTHTMYFWLLLQTHPSEIKTASVLQGHIYNTTSVFLLSKCHVFNVLLALSL